MDELDVRQLRDILGAIGRVRRVPVADLLPVCASTQPNPRPGTADRVRQLPRRGHSNRFVSERGTAHDTIRVDQSAPTVRGFFWPDEEETKPHLGTSLVYCRVCGDCEGGPWVLDEGLGVLVCEACDEALALLAALERRQRLQFWELVGHIVSGWVMV